MESISIPAGVVESVDTRDLKSLAPLVACGFKSRPRHKRSEAKCSGGGSNVPAYRSCGLEGTECVASDQ